jgi:Cu(I)/Ag(I) efflux system periplasmic protein CusF
MNTSKRTLAALATLLISCTLTARAASHAAAPSAASAVQSGAPMTSAEVRKVDKDNKKITLKHGEIMNLDMPPMTMVFKVKDAAMLDKLQPGDKVMFSAEKIDGAFTVTGIEAAK